MELLVRSVMEISAYIYIYVIFIVSICYPHNKFWFYSTNLSRCWSSRSRRRRIMRLKRPQSKNTRCCWRAGSGTHGWVGWFGFGEGWRMFLFPRSRGKQHMWKNSVKFLMYCISFRVEDELFRNQHPQALNRPYIHHKSQPFMYVNRPYIECWGSCIAHTIHLWYIYSIFTYMNDSSFR